jgi:hypothetical protein
VLSVDLAVEPALPEEGQASEAEPVHETRRWQA